MDEEGSAADGNGAGGESTRTRVRVFSHFPIPPRCFFARFPWIRAVRGRCRAGVVVGWASRAHAEPPAGGAGEIDGWAGKWGETSGRAVVRLGFGAFFGLVAADRVPCFLGRSAMQALAGRAGWDWEPDEPS